jgi:hypothetical protein
LPLPYGRTLIDLLRCCRFGKSKIFALIHFLIEKAGAYPAKGKNI